jgi:beta-lactamase class A
MGMRAVMAGLAALTALTAGSSTVGTSQAAAARLPAARAAAAGRTEATGAALASSPGSRALHAACTAPAAYRAVAAKLAAGIAGVLRGREGDRAVTVYDPVTGISCQADGGRHFDSASIVKAIILAALLRWHQEAGTPLSAWEKYEAALMITQSDDDAADRLWSEVGMRRLRHFLSLAKMSETELGPGIYWGLTQATAHDEMVLLRLLTRPNPVLSDASRSHELGLMARVIPGQRWGAPAGAPAGVSVHVKNGWLPDGTGWHVNSIGAFTGRGTSYLIAVLTDDNPAEQYGIDTIEDVARLVHRELGEARSAARTRLAANLAPTAAAPSAPSPWALVPALPAPPSAPSPSAVVPALPAPPAH